MSFAFLTPAALLGLALLSIPILLHIFKPRKVRQTPFSSLRWLRASQHRISRRIRWHQVLLFLLRAAFVTFLVLALARPILSFNVSSSKTDRFVILDVGSAMDYRADDQPRPIETGKRVAEGIVARGGGSGGAGDRTAILLAGSRMQTLSPLASDASAQLARLKNAAVEPASANLADALRLVRPMIGDGRPDATTELYFITANRARNWSQAPVAKFVAQGNPRVHVNIVDVGPAAVHNAWIAGARLIQSPDGQRRAIRVQVGAVGNEPQHRTVRLARLSGLAAGTDVSKSVEVPADGIAQVDFDLPSDLELKNKAAEVRLEPADALPADDVAWVNLDAAGAMNVLLIEPPLPESTAAEQVQPSFHLRSALDALSYSAPGTIRVARKPATAILTNEIAQADVIVLVEAPKLSDDNLRALQQRVKAGAGLAIFLGPALDADFYNTRLHDALHPADSLLPAAMQDEIATNAPDGLARMSNIQQRHPLFNGLLDPVFGDLGQAQFKAIRPLTLDAGAGAGDARVLAKVNDVPAVLDQRVGNGRVLVLNFTANDLTSDLPRRRSFVPLVDRMLDYLGGPARHGVFTAGMPIALPLPNATADTAVSIKPPSGQMLHPTPVMSAGRAMLQLKPLAQGGIYQVDYDGSNGHESFPLVVQNGESDTRLARADEKTLRAWWGGTDLKIIHPRSADEVLAVAGRRVSLDPWMILAACVFLLAEMFFVHWLCPKVNPTVATGSVVAQQGFFKPGRGIGAQPAGEVMIAG
ncbi:MAG TPA: BatA and WFA domain-containing protein [Tepidisphaeraceae bacterium]|jgi:hypothetical protein